MTTISGYEISFEIETNDKFNFSIIVNGSMSGFLKRIETWQVLKIDEARQSVFMGKVGKDGKLLKANPGNVANVPFSWLALGFKMRNLSKVKNA